MARTLAAEIAAGAIARDRDRTVPQRELDALSASGLLAITVPRAFGGADAAYATVVEVFRLLSIADPAIGQLPQNHFLFVEALRQDGTPDQQRRFFNEVLSGARLGNAQAERGSSALDLRTRLTRDGDAFRLNGTKYYCTGALTAQWIPVAAIDADERQVLAFVRREAEGVDVLGDWDVIGQRVTFSGTARFDNVLVSAGDVVPHWRLFDRPTLFHSYGVLLHAAIDVGIARAALEDLIAAVRQRQRPRLGARAPSAEEDRLLQARLGRAAVELHALEALLGATAVQHDRAATAGIDEEASGRAAVAAFAVKALAEDVAIDSANLLFALSGASAAESRHGYDRHWRNARVHTIHDANDWRLVLVGEHAVHGVYPAKPVRRGR
ncbi:SfnB family sulfur acquisition oxidoreductase [Sphingomonas sp. BK580]|nr:SfnB family sulfur acquisition oxidoreductase [Sphingomonas sp. BK580]